MTHKSANRSDARRPVRRMPLFVAEWPRADDACWRVGDDFSTQCSSVSILEANAIKKQAAMVRELPLPAGDSVRLRCQGLASIEWSIFAEPVATAARAWSSSAKDASPRFGFELALFSRGAAAEGSRGREPPELGLRRRRYTPEPRSSEAAVRRSAALGNGPFRIDYAEGVTQSWLRHASSCGTLSAYGFLGAGDPGCAASRGCAALPATLGFGV